MTKWLLLKFSCVSGAVFIMLVVKTASLFPTVNYTFATLNFDSETNISTANISSPIRKFKVTDSYIARLSLAGTLQIWSLQNQTLLYSAFFGTSLRGTLVCTDFSISPDEKTLGATFGTNSSKLAVIYKIKPNQLEQITNFPFSNSFTLQGLEVLSGEFAVFWTRQFTGTPVRYSNYFVRYDYINNGAPIGLLNTLRITNYTIRNKKTCNSSFLGNFYYVLNSKSQCYFELYKCLSSSCSAYFNYFSASPCTATEWSATTPEFQMQFSSDCSLLNFQQKNLGVRLFNVTSKTFVQNYTSTYTQNLSIASMTFTDTQKIYLGITTLDGMYKTYQFNPNTSIDLYNFSMPSYGGFSRFNLKSHKLITANDTGVYFYSMKCHLPNMFLLPQGFCIQCPSNCKACDASGICSQCIQNYTLSLNDCISTPSPPLANTSQQNSTNQSATNYIKDNPPSLAQTQSKSNSMTVAQTYFYEEDIGQFIQQSLAKPIIQGAIIAVKILQIFPFSYLFLRFLNFWSICSFYILTGVPLPKHLASILKIIYEKTNESIFEKISIPNQFNLSSQEKITGFLSDQYGLTSDFIDTNFENFSFLLVSYVILGIFYGLKRLLPRNNLFQKQIQKINYSQAFIGQFIPIMSSFFTNSEIIRANSYQGNFYQKQNMSLQLLFIWISLKSFQVILFITQKKKRRKAKENIEQKRIRECQERHWILACSYNSIFPFFAVIGRTELFCVVSGFLLGYDMYASFKQVKFKINSILMSLEIILFNIGFTLLVITYKMEEIAMYHHMGLCMTILLVVGGIHECLTLACNQLRNVIIYFVKYKKSFVTPIDGQKLLMKQTEITLPTIALSNFSYKKGKRTAKEKIFKTSIPYEPTKSELIELNQSLSEQIQISDHLAEIVEKTHKVTSVERVSLTKQNTLTKSQVKLRRIEISKNKFKRQKSVKYGSIVIKSYKSRLMDVNLDEDKIVHEASAKEEFSDRQSVIFSPITNDLGQSAIKS